MQRLLTGDVLHYEVKLLEGWSVRRVLTELASHEMLEHELVGAR